MRKKRIKKSLTTIERLAVFIKTIGLNFKEFEKTIELGNGYIGKQLKRKAGVGSNILYKISIKYPELNITWLITGKQKMTLENQLKLIKQPKRSSSKLRVSA